MYKRKQLQLAVLMAFNSLSLIPVAAHAETKESLPKTAQQDNAGETLPEIAISSTRLQEDATGPVEGYVAKRTATATKTDTLLIETPQSISVIGREQLEEQGVSDLGQALRYTPGVQGEPFGVEPRFTFIRLRGFDATTTGLFRDGLKLSNPGFAVSYGLEPYGAERIEAMRGPSSVLYGQASPGGLVNYMTKRPTVDMVNEMGVQLGNFDRKQGTLDVGGALNEDASVLYRLTGLIRDSQTQIDYVNDDRIYIAPALTLRPSDNTSLTILTHYQKDDTRSSQALPAVGTLYGNPNGRIRSDRFTGEPGVDRYEREEYSLTTLLEHRIYDNVVFRQNARFFKSDLNNVSVYSSRVQPDQRTIERGYFKGFGNLSSFTVDNQLQYQLKTGQVQHTLLAGYDYQHVDLDSLQAFNEAPPLDILNPSYGAVVPDAATFRDDNVKQRQNGLYLQDQIKYNRWVMSLAGRYDSASTTTKNKLAESRTTQRDHEFTGRAGLLYHFENGFAPYISYSESFLPALGNTPAGKPFEPELGKQYEAGIKYQPEGQRSFITLSAFDLTRKNYLQTDPATFLEVQRGEAESRGIEVQGLASLRRGLDLIFSYTYMDVEITKTTDPSELGQRPVQTPSHLASLWADYTLQGGPLVGLGLGAGVRYLGSTYGDAANTVKVPDVTLFDAAVHYDWKQMRLAINAQNLFDRDYVASAFTRGVDAFTVAGQERTVRATLTYRW